MAPAQMLELPKVPAKHRNFLKYLSHRGKENPRSLLQPYIDYESRLREIFAQQPQHPALTDPYVNVVPVFEGEESNVQICARDVQNEDDVQQNKFIMPLKDVDRKPHEAPAIVTSLSDFQSNFSIFSEASLSELDWSNVVAAGSSVVTSLLPIPKEFAESKRTKREWYHEKFAPASDVDLFLYGLSEEAAVEKIKQIERCIRDSVLQETTTVRTKNAITIVSQYPVRHVQIVLRIYKSISEILTGFDVDCSCAAYDGKQVYASPRALVSFMTQVNEIDLSRRSPSYENRLQKYAKRGFEVHWPPLDRSRIDPTIFERNFARTNGLARLLVYEKLPNNSDREAYTDERRKERGRPEVNRYFRHRQELPGNIKQNAIDEVNEGIDEDEVANYHTFTVPYGPKFTPKKIERLLYTKDLLFNAEWNKPKDREVNLHRHPAFFGAVEDVIGDCCGFCPVPQTEEEKAVAEEESKVFLRGDISFMKDDPGRQAIGSFNPVDDDEWTKMAYVGGTARLCAAITHDDLDFVQKWCAVEGNDVNERDYCGRTPLHLAVLVATPRIVQCLIDHGARLIARLADGKTSLHIAAIRGGHEGLKITRALLRQSEANEEEEARKEEAKRKENNKQSDNKDEHDRVGQRNDAMSSGENLHFESNAETSAPRDTTTEGSFVKVKDETAHEKDLDASDESTNDPDIYNVNVYSWDIQVPALHYAVVLGHFELVEELVQSFGADVLVPVKLVDSLNGQPREAILTLVLALNVPSALKMQMVSTLLKLGASSSQADVSEVTALHRYVKARQADLVKILIEHDGPAAKKAINHFVAHVNWGDYGNGIVGPLMTAIKTRDHELVETLIQGGAKPAVSLQDAQKNASQTYGKLTKDDFGVKLEQPVITAAVFENPAIVKLLIENGADVNTLTTEGHRMVNSEDPERYCETPAESLLDFTRRRIRELEESDPTRNSKYDFGAVTPVTPPPSQKSLAGVPEGTFKAYRILSEMQRGESEYERQVKNFQRMQRERQERPGLDLKKEAIKSIITSFKSLESTLLGRGAKTFDELYPSFKAINEHVRLVPKSDRRPWMSPPGPWKFEPTNLGFDNSQGMNDDIYTGCEKMFEGAWSGNLEPLQSHCLRMWGAENEQTPLHVTISSNESFTPFTLAVLRGHLTCAKGILDICAAQYQGPDDPNSKKRYHIRTAPVDEYDDLEEDEDEDEVQLSDREEDPSLTMDVAANVSDQAKNHIRPETAMDHRVSYFRIRDIAPAGYPDKEDNGPYQHALTVFQYAIVTGNRKLFDWLFDLKLHYQREARAREEYLKEPLVSIEDFQLAMRFERIDMLAELVRRGGAGLFFEELVQNSGVHIPEKPKFYQGLTVYGSKRKAWAQRERQNRYASQEKSSTPPLLHAVWSASPKVIQWVLGSEPERLYQEFAESNRETKHMQALYQAEGSFHGQLSKWLRARGNLALLYCMLSRKFHDARPRSLETLKLLASQLPALVNSKSPTRGCTPLMLAMGFADVEGAKILIDAGADQTCRDKEGNNLLHYLFSGVSGDSRKDHTPIELRTELLDLLDSRVLPSLFLERSSATDDQSFLTPLAKWLRARKDPYTRIDGDLLRRRHHWDDRAADEPQNYPDDGTKQKLAQDLDDLSLLLARSPDNKDLNALDGAGDTVAHYTARHAMFPLFAQLIERRPALLWRENAVGRTPFEIVQGAWLDDRLKNQPQIGGAGFGRCSYSLEDGPCSVAMQRPEHFLALRRYETRVREGGELPAELVSFTERMYYFCVEVNERLTQQRAQRRLVSLNEANVVAERLARREDKARAAARRVGPRARGEAAEGAGKDMGAVDDVEEVLKEKLRHSLWTNPRFDRALSAKKGVMVGSLRSGWRT